jgi:uncharacterized membrane protein
MSHVMYLLRKQEDIFTETKVDDALLITIMGYVIHHHTVLPSLPDKSIKAMTNLSAPLSVTFMVCENGKCIYRSH